MDSKSPASSTNKLTLASTAAEGNNAAPLKKSVERSIKVLKNDWFDTDSAADEMQVIDKKNVENVGNNGKYEEQEDSIPDRYESTAVEEEYDQVQAIDFDLSLPSPSGDNVASNSTGEYSDQINQDAINENAILEDHQLPEVDPNSHPPTNQNIGSKSQGEGSEEVHQQAIIDKAILEGYPPPEVDPNSHPPTSQNITAEPKGEEYLF